MTEAPTLVPGRSCENCTLCCNVLAIAALDKPRLVWCQHCAVGAGCNIYSARPQECRDFYCAYRYSAHLGEEWRPRDCGIVVNFEAVHNRINVLVEPARARIWREPPFYGQIKAWAANILRTRGHVLVWEGADGVVVFPDREVNLGDITGRVVVVMGRTTPQGDEYDALALAPDDPRLAQFKPTS